MPPLMDPKENKPLSFREIGERLDLSMEGARQAHDLLLDKLGALLLQDPVIREWVEEKVM